MSKQPKTKEMFSHEGRLYRYHKGEFYVVITNSNSRKIYDQKLIGELEASWAEANKPAAGTADKKA